MDTLNFTFRLLKHGSIFLLKLVGIGLSAFGETARTESSTPRPMSDYRHASVTGHFPDGTPERWEYANLYVEDDEK